MRRYGHWGVTLIIAVPFIVILPVQYSMIFVGMMIATTLLPNKEIAVSFLNRRGGMHTIWAAVLTAAVFTSGVGFLLSLVVLGFEELQAPIPRFLQPWRIAFLFGAGAFTGVISHLIGDTLIGGDSKPSIRPFWPITRTPIRFGLADPRNPFVNDGLFKIMVVLTVILYVVKLLRIP